MSVIKAKMGGLKNWEEFEVRIYPCWDASTFIPSDVAHFVIFASRYYNLGVSQYYHSLIGINIKLWYYRLKKSRDI